MTDISEARWFSYQSQDWQRGYLTHAMERKQAGEQLEPWLLDELDKWTSPNGELMEWPSRF